MLVPDLHLKILKLLIYASPGLTKKILCSEHTAHLQRLLLYTTVTDWFL
jgi:hypothetical protein